MFLKVKLANIFWYLISVQLYIVPFTLGLGYFVSGIDKHGEKEKDKRCFQPGSDQPGLHVIMLDARYDRDPTFSFHGAVANHHQHKQIDL